MDGVLVAAKDWHYEALSQALIEFGHAPISRVVHLTTFDGLPTRKKLHMLNISEERIEQINTRKQEITQQIIEEKSKPDIGHG